MMQLYKTVDLPSKTISPCKKRCIDCQYFPDNQLQSLGVNYVDRKQFLIQGKTEKLSQQAYRLLCAFSQNIEKNIDRNTLLQYGWPDDNVVQNNLAVVISELRTALRNSQLSIENIRGFGYKATVIKKELNYVSILPKCNTHNINSLTWR